MKHGSYNRQMGSLIRLEEQLKTGKKNNKGKTYPLTDTDTKRIEKQIGVLNTKLKGVTT